jgi:hypothetical protein
VRDLALVQTALPLLMIGWLLLGRAPTRADLLLRLGTAWAVLVGMWLAGIWLAMPLATVAVLAALLAVASVVAWRRTSSAGRPGRLHQAGLWAGRLLSAVLLVFAAWLIGPAVAGRGTPAGAVDLAFPLRSGFYLVANGGASERINGHLMTLRPAFARWRGESYAVDLIRIDRLGFRTRERKLLGSPASPDAYLTYGEPVYSPCRGTVEAVEQGRPDMPVPVRDRGHLEGNFVWLRCGSVVVLLAHFARKGVRVDAGQAVNPATLLGYVGNSGNTDEPHLHIHAQRPGPPSAPLSGEPLFVTFGGRFLVRNMVVDAGR